MTRLQVSVAHAAVRAGEAVNGHVTTMPSAAPNGVDVELRIGPRRSAAMRTVATRHIPVSAFDAEHHAAFSLGVPVDALPNFSTANADITWWILATPSGALPRLGTITEVTVSPPDRPDDNRIHSSQARDQLTRDWSQRVSTRSRIFDIVVETLVTALVVSAVATQASWTTPFEVRQLVLGAFMSLLVLRAGTSVYRYVSDEPGAHGDVTITADPTITLGDDLIVRIENPERRAIRVGLTCSEWYATSSSETGTETREVTVSENWQTPDGTTAVLRFPTLSDGPPSYAIGPYAVHWHVDLAIDNERCSRGRASLPVVALPSHQTA